MSNRVFSRYFQKKKTKKLESFSQIVLLVVHQCILLLVVVCEALKCQATLRNDGPPVNVQVNK